MAKGNVILVGFAVGILCPTAVSSQDRVTEIGTGLIQAMVIDFDVLQVATIAGRGPLASSLFLRVQYPGGLYLEPEANLYWLTDLEESIVAVGLGLTLGRQFGGNRSEGHWFGGAHVGVLGTEVDDLDGDVAIGAAFGRRVPIVDGHGSVRFEGRVRHWFDASTTNVSVLIGFGIVLNQ
jgi:hypothetical protein